MRQFIADSLCERNKKYALFMPITVNISTYDIAELFFYCYPIGGFRECVSRVSVFFLKTKCK